MIIEGLIYCLKIKSPCSMNTFIIQFQINEFQNQTLCNDKTENILKFDEMLIYDINYKKYTHKIVCQWFSPYQAYQDWTKYLRALIMYFQWVVFFSLQCMRLHLHDSAIFMQRSRSIPSICSYVLHDGRNEANIKKKVKCGSLMFVLNI